MRATAGDAGVALQMLHPHTSLLLDQLMAKLFMTIKNDDDKETGIIRRVSVLCIDTNTDGINTKTDTSMCLGIILVTILVSHEIRTRMG